MTAFSERGAKENRQSKIAHGMAAWMPILVGSAIAQSGVCSEGQPCNALSGPHIIGYIAGGVLVLTIVWSIIRLIRKR